MQASAACPHSGRRSKHCPMRSHRNTLSSALDSRPVRESVPPRNSNRNSLPRPNLVVIPPRPPLRPRFREGPGSSRANLFTSPCHKLAVQPQVVSHAVFFLKIHLHSSAVPSASASTAKSHKCRQAIVVAERRLPSFIERFPNSAVDTVSFSFTTRQHSDPSNFSHRAPQI